jgi:hypothetical protein
MNAVKPVHIQKLLILVRWPLVTLSLYPSKLKMHLYSFRGHADSNLCTVTAMHDSAVPCFALLSQVCCTRTASHGKKVTKECIMILQAAAQDLHQEVCNWSSKGRTCQTKPELMKQKNTVH